MTTLKFTSGIGVEKGIEMVSIEHLDNCQLIYLLSHKDAVFIRKGQDAYIQANL